MVLFRFLAVAVLAGALAFPAAAGAAKRDRTTAHGAVSRVKAPSPVKAAVTVAQRYWGATPCQGDVTILARRSVAAGLAPDSDAWASFDSPLGANNLAAPASSYGNCVITFARWRWPTAASMREDWDIFCTTMIHETGHLLGRAHDDTPGSVMLTVFTDHSSVPPICRETRPGR